MLQNIKQFVFRLGKDEIILYLSAVAVFLYPYVSAVLAVAAAVYALACEDTRRKILQIPKSKWILLTPAVLIPIPLLYGNRVGLAAALLIYAILVFSLYLRSVMTARLYRNIVGILCAASILCAVVALAQKLMNADVRTTAMFTNANYYAYATELILIMACHRLPRARSGGARFFYVVVLCANLLTMFTTGCRSAWVSVVCGLTVLFAAEKNQKGLAGLAGFALAYLLLALRFPDLMWRVDELNVSGSLRLQIWETAMNAILRHPLFGQGALAYYLISSKEFWHAHDLYLELLLSFGIVGTGMLFVYFADVLRRLVAGVRSASTGDKGIGTMLLALVSATLVHGLTDVTVMFTQTGILFALLLAGVDLVQQTAPERWNGLNLRPEPYAMFKG